LNVTILLQNMMSYFFIYTFTIKELKTTDYHHY